MQCGIGQPFLVGCQHVGVTAETRALRSLAERAGRSGLHGMGGVAAGADRCIAVLRTEPGFCVHAAEIGGVNIRVAVLAGNLLDLRRRILDDGMRIMTVGADGRRRVAAAHQRAVNAALPLLEFVGMAVAADLGRGNREAACTLYFFIGGRMRGRIDVGVTAGATVRAVDRFYERVGRHMQLQRPSVRQLFLHAGGAVTAKAILVGRGGCRVGCQCRRRDGR